MKTIVITGPSGSGKSYLSKKLSKLFHNTIIIKTDSYYRDNKLIKILSKFLYDIYDRILSIKKGEIKKTLKSIYNRDNLISSYNYDFKRKHSSKYNISINYNGDNQFLILEGIFSHRLDLQYLDTINIVCEEKKEICFKRRLKRDQLERNRDKIEVFKKFKISWYLFYKNVKTYLNNYKVTIINTADKDSYDKLILKLQQLKNN